MRHRAIIIGIAGVLFVSAPVSAVEDVTMESIAGGFEPRRTVADLGEQVRWTNDDDLPHTTTGRAPLSLWDRSLPAGSVRGRAFTQVGAFPYFCRLHPTMTGQVRVGLEVNGDVVELSERLVLRVATNGAPNGFRYRIQRRRPGASWKTWRTITARTTAWRPRAGAVGDWQFRARTERISNGARSSWSPPREISVVP